MAGAELEIKADLVVQYLCTMSPGEEFLGSLISFVESDGASMPQQPGPFYQHFGSWVCVEYIYVSHSLAQLTRVSVADAGLPSIVVLAFLT